MKLEFKKRQLEIDLYGEPVKLDFPTVGQYRAYEVKLKKDGNESELMLDFIVELGMPKKSIDGLEPQHLKTIIETLVGEGKK